MNLAHLLDQHARQSPQRAAIIEADRGGASRITTYAELHERTGRAAAGLERMGIQPGQRVLLLQPMSADLYIALLALWKLGAAAVVLDPGAADPVVDASCRLVQPQGLVGSTRAHLRCLLSPPLRRLRPRVVIGMPLPWATSWKRLQSQPPRDASLDVPPEHEALITFTSGSTGTPKAVVRTHGFLRAQHQALVQAIDLQPGQIDLATLPVFALANLASGLTTLIPHADLRRPGAIDAGPVMRQIIEHRPDRATASPAFLQRLAQWAGQHHLGMDSFTRLYVGGAPVFPHVMDELAHAAPVAEVIALYGSTEAEPIAHLSRHAIADAERAAMLGGKGLLAGDVCPSLRLKVIRSQPGQPLGALDSRRFGDLCCTAGEAGEIVVTGEHVLKGYFGGRGDEEAKFTVEGEVWHRTGDAGWRDAAGRLWLLGRLEAAIDVPGDPRVFPLSVEVAAAAVPGVRRVAFVQHQGRRVLAVESDDPGVVERLRRQCPELPVDDLRPLPRIPVDRRHNAKVDYPSLRAELDRRH